MNEPDALETQDGEIAELLRSAGSREEPAAHIKLEVEAAVREAWIEATRTRRRRRTAIWAIAASVCALGVASVLGLQINNHRGEPMATLARADGDVFVSNDASRWRRLSVGQSILVGESVRSDVRAAFTLDDGVSLRVDSGTSLEVARVDRITLNSGAVYVDSGPHSDSALQIQTFLGSVQHLGTQYQVRTRIDGIDVRVREGRVRVQSGMGSNIAAAGEHLSISAQGTVLRFSVSATGDEWTWASEAAPEFMIENASLAAFLDWAARETGRALIYDSPRARSVAMSELLHGSIEGLAPDAALVAVLATTSLRRNEARPEVIEVGVKAAD